jgi:hypothetical protein
VLAATIGVHAYAVPHATPKPQPSEHNLPLSLAAVIVQQAVAKYQTNTSSLKLDSIELTFKVSSGGSDGIGFTFWIITIGAPASPEIVLVHSIQRSGKLLPTNLRS